MSFRSVLALLALCAHIARAQDTTSGAAARVVAELQRIGTKPAGEKGTFYQSVPLVRRQLDSASVSLGFRSTSMVFPIDVQPLWGFSTIPFRAVFGAGGRDFLLGGRLGDSAAVDPRFLENAIVVMLPPLRANGQVDYQIWAYRKQLVRYGAVGALVFPTLEFMPRSVIADLNAARLELERPPIRDSVPPILLVTQAAARAIPAIPPRIDFADRRPPALGGASFNVKTDRPRSLARNVVALVEGSDARLKSEIIVITAPLGDDESGDADRARAANAAMLAFAAEMSSPAGRPKRSVAFVWTSGGEGGELGAQWFAEHPSVNRRDIVATFAFEAVNEGTLSCIREIANGGPRQRPCGA